MFARFAPVLLLFFLYPAMPQAQSASLFAQPANGGSRSPLIALPDDAPQTAPHASSLFAGTTGKSFFAPSPRSEEARFPPLKSGKATEAAQLRDLIAEAEAGSAEYDAVNHGARLKPPKPPSQMTIGEILAWIDATPGQAHAIGRYQFIPDTLRRLVKKTGVPSSRRFSPEVQNLLADELLVEAGLHAIMRGEITRRSFMYRLAKIWAGLPLPSGASYYEGYAGNKATMSWSDFSSGMAQIFPDAS